MKEIFDAMKEHSQQKRANNREKCAEALTTAGVMFEAKNGGAHLVVEGNNGFIDYWPGTGKWHDRNGSKGFGVRNLLKHLRI
jgi:hypothetical protein